MNRITTTAFGSSFSACGRIRPPNPFAAMSAAHPAASRALATAFAVTHGNGHDAYRELCAALRMHARMTDGEGDLFGFLDGLFFAVWHNRLNTIDPTRMEKLREHAQTFLDGGAL